VSPVKYPKQQLGARKTLFEPTPVRLSPCPSEPRSLYMDKAERDRLNGTETAPTGPPPSSHRFKCEACGQIVDMRRLGDMMHHAEDGHEPIPPDA
jgi:hypothetical protein